MYSDREVEQRHVVVNAPGERRESFTETTQETPREGGISPGAIMAIVIVALVAIGLTFYVVSNKNANEEANRQALIDASKAQPQQPAPVQAPAQQPVIIQQPVPAAPVSQAPVVIQQPPVVQERSNVLDDTTIQDAVSKRLSDDPGLSGVSALVISGKATLTGTVNSAELKSSAGRIARAVSGVKSVENKIEISNQ